jgi:hypothetical protein
VQEVGANVDAPSFGADAGNRDSAEVRGLKAELKRVTEEHDFLK